MNCLCECWESETVGHELFSCKLYSCHRQKLFVGLSVLGLVYFPLKTVIELGGKGCMSYLSSILFYQWRAALSHKAYSLREF